MFAYNGYNGVVKISKKRGNSSLFLLPFCKEVSNISRKPNKFKSGDDIIELWRRYCYEIMDNGFFEVPTQTAFCRWLERNYEKTDRKTLYNALYKNFPEIKNDFDSIRADVIAQGALTGKYQATMSIFSLKHWCHWSDGSDNTPSSNEIRIVDDI